MTINQRDATFRGIFPSPGICQPLCNGGGAGFGGQSYAHMFAFVCAAVVWNKFDISGLLMQARHLISHKSQQQILTVADLSEVERQSLDKERRKRLADITHRSGLAMLKAISGHKVRTRKSRGSFACTYIHTYIHTYTRAHSHTHTHTHTHTYTHKHTHTHTHTRTHTRTHAHTHAHTHARMYVNLLTSMLKG